MTIKIIIYSQVGKTINPGQFAAVCILIYSVAPNSLNKGRARAARPAGHVGPACPRLASSKRFGRLRLPFS